MSVNILIALYLLLKIYLLLINQSSRAQHLITCLNLLSISTCNEDEAQWSKQFIASSNIEHHNSLASTTDAQERDKKQYQFMPIHDSLITALNFPIQVQILSEGFKSFLISAFISLLPREIHYLSTK